MLGFEELGRCVFAALLAADAEVVGAYEQRQHFPIVVKVQPFDLLCLRHQIVHLRVKILHLGQRHRAIELVNPWIPVTNRVGP